MVVKCTVFNSWNIFVLCEEKHNIMTPLREVSRTAATSKMELLVIIVNGFRFKFSPSLKKLNEAN